MDFFLKNRGEDTFNVQPRAGDVEGNALVGSTDGITQRRARLRHESRMSQKCLSLEVHLEVRDIFNLFETVPLTQS